MNKSKKLYTHKGGVVATSHGFIRVVYMNGSKKPDSKLVKEYKATKHIRCIA